MDKPCHSSSSDSPASSLSTSNLNPSSISSAGAGGASAASTAASGGDKDQFLRHLSKLSHKISKPSSSSSFTRRLPIESSTAGHLLRPPPPPQAAAAAVGPPLQHQPPVYNINKSDFRDVVQKLTGSPAHHAPPQPQPPPIHAPKPASSRLQRIRPPPLAQLTNLPPPMLNPTNPAALSPLPPLPTCHAAAESPISAYMRFLRGSVHGGVDYDPMHMFPPPSPVDSSAPPPPSTAAFGCLPSPTGSGPLGLPLSPTVPGVPSPK